MKNLKYLFEKEDLDTFMDYIVFSRESKNKIKKNKIPINKTIKIAILSSSTVYGVKEIMYAKLFEFNILC